MNTVWLRALMRRYGRFGLLFVAAYLVVYSLWKRIKTPSRAALRQWGALILVFVIGSQGVFFLLGPHEPPPETAFIAILRQGKFAEALRMLESGADPNDTYTDLSNAPCVVSTTSALEMAVRAEQIPLVEALFRHGLHPNGKAETSALASASVLEKDVMLRILLAHGLRFETKDSKRSRSALIDVLGEKHALRGAGRLLDAGANVNWLDEEGQTALAYASRSEDLPLARLLLAHGADPNRNDPQGLSALSWARVHKQAAMVILLKKHGAHE